LPSSKRRIDGSGLANKAKSLLPLTGQRKKSVSGTGLASERMKS
jgi:hypothetical protein